MQLHNFNENKDLNSWGTVTLNGKKAFLAYSRVSAVPYNIWWVGKQRDKKDTEEAPFISFSDNEEVKVEVKTDKIKADSEILIRPLSKNVKATVNGNIASFTLKEHGAYTFEVDGFNNALHIFYNPERDFVAEETNSGRKIMRFTAGVHDVGNVELPSHTSVIIDADAVVYGSFTAIHQEDIRICGYGIIDGSKEIRTDDTLLIPVSVKEDNYAYAPVYTQADLTEESALRKNIKDYNVLNGLIRFYCCKDFSVEGVIMRDSSTFCFVPAACDNFVIDNIKTIGMWRYNSDGIDLFNCTNATIKNCFLRNFDDCIVIKGIMGWEKQNNENIVIDNCTVWCDWGSALEIGAETNADEYKNIVYKNCNIIHAVDVIMRIHHHNRAHIKDVEYKNICVDISKYTLPPIIIEEGKDYFGKPGHLPNLFNFIIVNDGAYSDKKMAGTIDGVKVEGIRIFKDDESGIPHSNIFGCDEEHKVKNVLIENIYVNGEKSEDFAKYIDNLQFTENVNVK